ncbi:TolC family outer membrane protein [Methylomonas sp. MED-D]|uniref:TolC family outer membrane protein n=1 Tax=unclassified Methylomonas TaxID=2608980 RepID=UPI0008DA5B9D|nr:MULTISPECIES: TolC family outer membrane protein [unclassified Methylomonas]MDT4332587.1 TolC family outer membrane protein [Methylomonas sp. MV1]NJA07644.1 TolC family outer membrane protein [Methylococcaceae bacterium WWC4]OHX34607.1 type I secretion protein TolC [Methylomonas sp. LWB]
MKSTTGWGVSIAIQLAFATDGYAVTLQDSIQKVLDDNPKIQAAKSERRAVEEEIGQAKAGYFPTVDATAGIGWEESNNPTTRTRGDGSVFYHREEGAIQVRQMLFDGLATPNEVERQEKRTDSRAYTVFGQSEITALDGVEAYLKVLRRQELLNLAKDNLQLHLRTNEQIKLRSERGVGKRADVDQSMGRVALAEKNVWSETGNLKDAETGFQRVIGILPDAVEPVAAPTAALPATMEQAIDEALADHPILKSANSDVESAFAQHETAKAPYFPRFDIETGVSHNYNLDGIRGTNSDMTAMLRMRYNLFNGGKDIARREQTAQLINQAKDIRDNTHRQVVESMRLSWVAYQTVKSQMEFYKQHADSAEKTITAYQQQFNIGQRTLLDLLDTYNEMYVAKSSLINAKYDELFSQYRILASKGQLNKHLGTKLPEEIQPISSAD